MDYLKNIYAHLTQPEAIALAAGAILSAIAGHIWRRFRNRTIVLKFSARHTNLAHSSENLFGDKLQVLYRNQEVKGLYVTDATIRNDSGADLENVVIILEYRKGEQYYGGSGKISGSPKNLLFSNDFQQIIDRARQPGPIDKSPDLPYLMRTREFLIPVLNRGSIVEFSLLTHSEKFPYLHAVCHHKGVKIVEEKAFPKLLGVAVPHAAIVGLLAGIVLLVFLFPLFISIGRAMTVAFILGAFGQLIGIGFIWLFRLFIRLLS